MKRTLLGALCGLALAGGAAFAEPSPGRPGDRSGDGKSLSTQAAGKADEPKKHLGEIDVYLATALAHTKVVYQSTQLIPGGLDATIQREGLSNIDQAISSAQTHIGHIRAMPEARVADMGKLDELSQSLNQGKRLVSQLRTAVKTDGRREVQALASRLYGELRTADDLYGQIAEKQNVVRLDRIDVPERQDVSGRDQPDIDRDRAVPPPSAPGRLDHDDTLDKGPLFNRSNRNTRDLTEPTPHVDSPSAPPLPPPQMVPPSTGVKPRTDNQRSLDRLPERSGIPSDSESGSTGRQY